MEWGGEESPLEPHTFVGGETRVQLWSCHFNTFLISVSHRVSPCSRHPRVPFTFCPVMTRFLWKTRNNFNLYIYFRRLFHVHVGLVDLVPDLLLDRVPPASTDQRTPYTSRNSPLRLYTIMSPSLRPRPSLALSWSWRGSGTHSVPLTDYFPNGI